MGRRAWWATVHGVTRSQTRLSAHTHTCTYTFVIKLLEQILLSILLGLRKLRPRKKNNNLPQRTELVIGQTKIYQSLRYVAFYEIEKKI